MKTYDELFFTDDFLFSKIMRDEEIAKGVVESLLGIKVGRIEFLTSQYSINEIFNGRGVRLDVYLKDSDKVFDVEMQTVIKRDEGLRMRYYQSIIDIEQLDVGQNYKDLKETYIIFICLDDPFGIGNPVYRFCTRDIDSNYCLNDRMHKVIYNASSFEKAADKNVKAFLSYIKNRNSSDELTDKIQSAVNVSKNHQPWRAEYMLWKDQIAEWKDDAREEGLAEGREKGLAEGREKGLAEGLAEGRAEGRAEGFAIGKSEIARNLLKMNMPIDVVKKATGLTEEELLSYNSENHN